VVSLSQGDVCLSCSGSVDLGVLLPHLAEVIIEEVDGGQIRELTAVIREL
jgi:hypothetical protein